MRRTPWAEWLGNQGHDVVEAQTLGPDPGDRALLELAESENRVLVTMDKEFGELIYLRRVSHAYEAVVAISLQVPEGRAQDIEVARGRLVTIEASA